MAVIVYAIYSLGMEREAIITEKHTLRPCSLLVEVLDKFRQEENMCLTNAERSTTTRAPDDPFLWYLSRNAFHSRDASTVADQRHHGTTKHT